jgi:hypothetical protein
MVYAYSEIKTIVTFAMGKKQPDEDKPKRPRHRSWLWPLGIVTTGMAGTALLLLRGCWHSKMSWPIRVEGYSYQVCLGCGVKRLFDEGTFQGYGGYSYELHDLIARDRVARLKEHREAESRTNRASAG